MQTHLDLLKRLPERRLAEPPFPPAPLQEHPAGVGCCPGAGDGESQPSQWSCPKVSPQKRHRWLKFPRGCLAQVRRCSRGLNCNAGLSPVSAPDLPCSPGAHPRACVRARVCGEHVGTRRSKSFSFLLCFIHAGGGGLCWTRVWRVDRLR